MEEKFCRLDIKGVAYIASLGFDYFSVTQVMDAEREEMGIRAEAEVKAYYFAQAGSTAADEQNRALYEYAGVRFTEEDGDEEWTKMAIGSDELADLLNDGAVRVWTFCEVFEEGGDTP